VVHSRTDGKIVNQLMRKDVGPWLMCGAAGKGLKVSFHVATASWSQQTYRQTSMIYVHVSVPVESLVQLSLFHFGSLPCKNIDRTYSDEPWVPVKMLILLMLSSVTLDLLFLNLFRRST
jgi:hypothetical protein